MNQRQTEDPFLREARLEREARQHEGDAVRAGKLREAAAHEAALRAEERQRQERVDLAQRQGAEVRKLALLAAEHLARFIEVYEQGRAIGGEEALLIGSHVSVALVARVGGRHPAAAALADVARWTR